MAHHGEMSCPSELWDFYRLGIQPDLFFAGSTTFNLHLSFRRYSSTIEEMKPMWYETVASSERPCILSGKELISSLFSSLQANLRSSTSDFTSDNLLDVQQSDKLLCCLPLRLGLDLRSQDHHPLIYFLMTVTPPLMMHQHNPS